MVGIAYHLKANDTGIDIDTSYTQLTFCWEKAQIWILTPRVGVNSIFSIQFQFQFRYFQFQFQFQFHYSQKISIPIPIPIPDISIPIPIPIPGSSNPISIPEMTC